MCASADRPPIDAIILAGGNSRRMGTKDKLQCEISGSSLLDRAIAVTISAVSGRVIVARGQGATARVDGRIHWVADAPTIRGPVAGVLAALDQLQAPLVLVIAADMPLLSAAGLKALGRPLITSAANSVCVATDDSGHRQVMATVWRTPDLQAACDRLASDHLQGTASASMYGLLQRAPEGAVEVTLPSSELVDVDTPGDLEELRLRSPS